MSCCFPDARIARFRWSFLMLKWSRILGLLFYYSQIKRHSTAVQYTRTIYTMRGRAGGRTAGATRAGLGAARARGIICAYDDT